MSMSFAIPIALTSVLALVLTLPGALTIRSTPTPAALSLKSESQLKSESALYETAIREIGTIANMKLTTPEELKKANDIVAKHIRNLKYGRSRLVSLALSDAVFVDAVKARAKDDKSAEAFALELAKDPNSILKLAGADSLRNRVQFALQSDTTTLQRVAEHLKRSANEVKATLKQHHSSRFIQRLASVSPALQPPDTFLNVIILVCTAFVVASFLAPALAHAVPAAIGAVLIGRLVSNIGSEQGRDKVAECMEEVDKKYQDCLAAAAQLPFGFGIVAMNLCYADWLIAVAQCQFVE